MLSAKEKFGFLTVLAFIAQICSSTYLRYATPQPLYARDHYRLENEANDLIPDVDDDKNVPLIKVDLQQLMKKELGHPHEKHSKHKSPKYKMTYKDLQLLANALLQLDNQVHNAQNVVDFIKRTSEIKPKFRIHYNYYDENATPSYYDEVRRRRSSHKKNKKQLSKMKKKPQYSSSDSRSQSKSNSQSDSRSDSRSSEESLPVKPLRFEVVDKNAKKRPRQPALVAPPVLTVETDKSSQSDEATTPSPLNKKQKDKDVSFDYIQGRLRRIKNKGRRAGMRLDYFLPKRYQWKEEDLPKLGYLWFNTGITG